MNEIVHSVKRLIDLIYVFAAIWGLGQAIEWIMSFGV